MKNLLLFLLWAGLAAPSLSAQEGLINDVPPEPFSGTVHYRISYEGPNSARWAVQLPDSMTLRAQGTNLEVRMWNGAADSLIHTYLYLGDSDAVYILDHVHQVAFSAPHGHEFKTQAVQPLTEAGAESILGRPVQLFQVGAHEQVAIDEALFFPLGPPDSLTRSRPGFLSGRLHGIPLRMQRRGQMTVRTEAVAIVPGEIEALGLPEGYTVEPFFSRRLRHPYFSNRKE